MLWPISTNQILEETGYVQKCSQNDALCNFHKQLKCKSSSKLTGDIINTIINTIIVTTIATIITFFSV